jgi:hypothetical protein
MTTHEQCLLCLDTIRIPVELICFPCSLVKTQLHCHSVNRICLHCARVYLQLNEVIHKRKKIVKCLFCDVITNPQTLNADNSYKKDYRMMVSDGKTDYKCIHEDLCSFTGSQMELECHVRSKCQYRMCFCVDCHVRYRADTNHSNFCKARLTCFSCGEHVLKTKLSQHLEEKHNRKKCLYCKKVYQKHMLPDHTDHCQYKPIECSICYKYVKKGLLYGHLKKHKNYFQSQITLIQKQVQDII